VESIGEESTGWGEYAGKVVSEDGFFKGEKKMKKGGGLVGCTGSRRVEESEHAGEDARETLAGGGSAEVR
jgi:hypothetical protein